MMKNICLALLVLLFCQAASAINYYEYVATGGTFFVETFDPTPFTTTNCDTGSTDEIWQVPTGPVGTESWDCDSTVDPQQGTQHSRLTTDGTNTQTLYSGDGIGDPVIAFPATGNWCAEFDARIQSVATMSFSGALVNIGGFQLASRGAGLLRLNCSGNTAASSNGSALTADTWYRFHIEGTHVAGANTGEWWIDTVSQGTCTGTDGQILTASWFSQAAWVTGSNYVDVDDIILTEGDCAP